MTPKKTHPTLEVAAGDLQTLIRPLLPLVDQRSLVPMLAAIHLRTVGDYLVGEATDRYRAGISRIPTTSENFDALIRAADLRRILTLFKATRTDNPELKMTLTDGRLRVEGSGMFDMVEAGVTFTLEAGNFPQVGRLVRKAMQADSSDARVALNARFLADWKHAVSGGDPVVIRAGSGGHPTIFVAGDNFIGLQMPVGSSQAKGDLFADDWAPILDADTEPEASTEAVA